jgi:hypothetical protein
MTIEQKAAAYDEAIERAKKVLLDCTSEEQKVVEYITPELKESDDEKMRKGIIRNLEYLMDRAEGFVKDELKERIAWLEKQARKPTELPKGEDYGIDGLYAVIDILQNTLGKVDGYQTDDGILEHKCAISTVKKLYEKKPVAWSEEDDVNLVRAQAFIKNTSLKDVDEIKESVLTWITSLKGRVQPQSQWKPSDAQMNAIKDSIDYLGRDTKIVRKHLMSLYQDLNKLKE